MVRNSLKIVRNLTLPLGSRREIDALARARRITVWAIVLLLPMPAFAASAWQSPAEIAATAEAFLEKRIGRSAERTTVEASQLDPRHRLAKCDEPLEAFLRRGTKITPRTIVGVRCTGSKPWKLYVPVDVVVTDSVLVSKRTLPRGHLLTADDLVVEQRDVSRLISGYIARKSDLVGQRLKTQLLAGRVLTPAMLQADAAVRRGQLVTLVAQSGGIAVRMSGKSLMDGAINQRVRVENMNSGRVVEGIVRSRETVEVLLPAAGTFFHAKPKGSP
jgi:flagella basal body P-ring formation protein FlgA